MKEIKINVWNEITNIFKSLWGQIVGIKCPTCSKTYHNKNDVLWLLEYWECFKCDQLRTDAIDGSLSGDSAEDFGEEEESLERFNMSNFWRNQ